MPVGHAAAATIGGLVFVIGGRSNGPGTQTRAIYAIDPATGDVRFAGTLPVGLSDPAVATSEDSILIAGGLTVGPDAVRRAGTVAARAADVQRKGGAGESRLRGQPPKRSWRSARSSSFCWCSPFTWK